MEVGIPTKQKLLVASIAILIASAFGYLSYQNYTLKKDSEAAHEEIAQRVQESRDLLDTLAALKIILATSQSDKTNLEQDLAQKQDLLDSIESQVRSMTGTVGTLQKLSTTDKELLKKYSRVYFLNENYVPKNFLPIPPSYVYENNSEKLFENEALPFLQKLLDDASTTAHFNLKILSAYRSFGTQSALKSTYRVTYGSGANTFSADQGYSEHQLGTTVDFTTLKAGANLSGFEKTPEYAWLTANAYQYGFILSYPKNNSYYVFEPWHWRFVGKRLALQLHNESKSFYDMSQREIDTYLISLFDD